MGGGTGARVAGAWVGRAVGGWERLEACRGRTAWVGKEKKRHRLYEACTGQRSDGWGAEKRQECSGSSLRFSSGKKAKWMHQACLLATQVHALQASWHSYMSNTPDRRGAQVPCRLAGTRSAAEPYGSRTTRQQNHTAVQAQLNIKLRSLCVCAVGVINLAAVQEQ